MPCPRLRKPGTTGVLALALLGLSGHEAVAANAGFQDYFFLVCQNPTGALAQRCAETDQDQGDLSGDSESSLNPSQGLSVNDIALGAARAQAKQARERTERMREGYEELGPRVEVGPFGLLLHARAGRIEADRVVDEETERGYESDSWALEIGLDYRLDDRGFLGALLSYEETQLDFDAENPGRNFTPARNAGEIDTDGIGLTLFGAWQLSELWYVEGNAAWVIEDYRFRRSSVFQESNRSVPQTDVLTRSASDGSQTWAALNTGYAWSRGPLSLTPYAGLTYTNSEVDAYEEEDLNGSGLNMRFERLDRDSLVAHLGVFAAYVINTDVAVLQPQVRMELERQFGRDPDAIATSYLLDAAQNRYLTSHENPDENNGTVAFSMAAIFPGGWMPFFDVDYLFGDANYESWRVTAGFRLEL